MSTPRKDPKDWSADEYAAAVFANDSVDLPGPLGQENLARIRAYEAAKGLPPFETRDDREAISTHGGAAYSKLRQAPTQKPRKIQEGVPEGAVTTRRGIDAPLPDTSATMLESGTMGLREGANLSMGAKAVGAGAALADLVDDRPRAAGRGTGAGVLSAGDSAATARESAIATEDENVARAQRSNPWVYGISEITGGIAPTTALNEVGLLAKAKHLKGRPRPPGPRPGPLPTVEGGREAARHAALEMGKKDFVERVATSAKAGAKIGGPAGAIHGYGQSRSDTAGGTFMDTLEGAAEGTVGGGAVGGGFEVAMTPVRGVGRAVRGSFKGKLAREVESLERSGGGLRPTIDPVESGPDIARLERAAKASPGENTATQMAVRQATREAAAAAEDFRRAKVFGPDSIKSHQRAAYDSPENQAVDATGTGKAVEEALDRVLAKHDNSVLFAGDPKRIAREREKLLTRIMVPRKDEVPPTLLGPRDANADRVTARPNPPTRELRDRGPLGLLGFRTPPKTKQGVAPPPRAPTDQFPLAQEPPPPAAKTAREANISRVGENKDTPFPQEPELDVRVIDRTQLPRGVANTNEGLAEAGMKAPPKTAVQKPPTAITAAEPRDAASDAELLAAGWSKKDIAQMRANAAALERPVAGGDKNAEVMRKAALAHGMSEEEAAELVAKLGVKLPAKKGPQKYDEVVLNRPMELEQLDAAIRNLREGSGYYTRGNSGQPPTPEQRIDDDLVKELLRVRKERFPNYPTEPAAIQDDLSNTLKDVGIHKYGRLKQRETERALEPAIISYRGSDAVKHDDALQRMMPSGPRREALEAVAGTRAAEALRGRGAEVRATAHSGGVSLYAPGMLDKLKMRTAGMRNIGVGPAKTGAVVQGRKRGKKLNPFNRREELTR